MWAWVKKEAREKREKGGSSKRDKWIEEERENVEGKGGWVLEGLKRDEREWEVREGREGMDG